MTARPVPSLRREFFCLIEMALLKIAGGKDAQAIEGKQITDRSKLAIFRGRFACRTVAQLPGKMGDALRVCDWRRNLATNGNRLQPLRPHHRTKAAPTSMPTIGTQIGEPNQVLSRDTNCRHSTKGRQRARGLLRGAPPALTRPELAVDQFGGFRTCPDQNDRVDTELLPGDREMTARERIRDPTGQWRFRHHRELG